MSAIQHITIPARVAKGVVRGKAWAIEAAYAALAQSIMNLSMRILSDRGLAEEVLQDTFLDLTEKATQIRDAERVVGWVRKVATNHCLMKLRSPWHARRMEVEDTTLEEHLGGASEPQLEHAVEMSNIVAAMDTLSAETRAVIWLHDVEGYTHKEIGELMGRTASFSKSQLARGYEKLLDWHRTREAGQTGGARNLKEDADKATGEGTDEPGRNAKVRSIQIPCTP